MCKMVIRTAVKSMSFPAGIQVKLLLSERWMLPGPVKKLLKILLIKCLKPLCGGMQVTSLAASSQQGLRVQLQGSEEDLAKARVIVSFTRFLPSSFDRSPSEVINRILG